MHRLFHYFFIFARAWKKRRIKKRRLASAVARGSSPRDAAARAISIRSRHARTQTVEGPRYYGGGKCGGPLSILSTSSICDERRGCLVLPFVTSCNLTPNTTQKPITGSQLLSRGQARSLFLLCVTTNIINPYKLIIFRVRKIAADLLTSVERIIAVLWGERPESLPVDLCERACGCVMRAR